MIKKTLCFSNPVYLSVRNKQLVIRFPEIINSNNVSENIKREAERTIPIEDIGVVLLSNNRITITSATLQLLLDNNCAVVSCNEKGMPNGLFLPLCGNTTQSERFREQINSSVPLKKQLWQQTVRQKILNQQAVLSCCNTSVETNCMKVWANDVRSGDPDNLEARAAAFYWKHLFKKYPNFVRNREGEAPNNLLNYGYAILRAVIARSLVSSGLLPTLGIHHHNRYNAYCLADDIMEPYRPFVDQLVVDIINKNCDTDVLNKDIKQQLLSIPMIDVVVNNKRSPLMVAALQTTASLAKCFLGEAKRIYYPIINDI